MASSLISSEADQQNMETEPYPHIALQESHVRNDIRDIIVSGFEAIDVGCLREGSSESDLDDVCEDGSMIRNSMDIVDTKCVGSESCISKMDSTTSILDTSDEYTHMWRGSGQMEFGWQAFSVGMQHDERERLHWKGSRAKSLKQQTKDDHPGKRRHVRSMSEPIKPTSLSAIQTRDRTIVLDEILYSERVYVSCLKDIVEGYFQRCQEHTKLFASEKIELIFGNVDMIYQFHKDFLKELETGVDRKRIEDTHIGKIFVANKERFYALYTKYCENHPHSDHEMSSLMRIDQYALFFESCRLLGNFNMSLEDCLLSPLQKISRYPAQLSDLLKCFMENCADLRDIQRAHEVMKGVTLVINEQKKRLESVVKIALWQETITNWNGGDIYEKSTELIYSGLLHKISRGHSQERHFFLFDHQIVYCRKDAIGGKLTYKGRLSVDNCDIIDLQDGEELYGGSDIKNAWKMSNRDKRKWYVLYAKNPDHKRKWMESFQKERDIVADDNEKGFYVPLKTKKAAIALYNATTPAQKRKKNLLENAPSAPIGLKADHITATSMLISWLAPHRLNGTIRGYQVCFTPRGTNNRQCNADVAGEDNSIELTSLSPHTEYTISVRAKAEDFGDYSIPITISTLHDDVLSKLSSILDGYKTITFKELKIAKLVFYGTPRTGKTTLRKTLIGAECITPEPSTHIAETCDPVFVERIIMTGEEESEWKWTVQGLDDIAKTLLQCLDNKLLHSPPPNRQVDINKKYPFEKNVIKRQTSSTLLSISNPHHRNDPATCVVPLPEGSTKVIKEDSTIMTSSPIGPSQLSMQSDVNIDIKQLFLNAVKTGKWSEVVSALHILDKAMLIQIIDGGGQPSFQEIFPLLISGPSVTLLMFKLTDDLLESNPVHYQPSDRDEVEHKWQDTYVVRDCISHALSSLISLQPDSIKSKPNDPLHSKVLLVGTHRDQLKGSEDQKKAEILKCAQLLLGWLRQSKAFRLISAHSIEDFITDISNFNPEDIIRIRKKIENLISQREPQNIPAPWLVFDFSLHKYAKTHMMRKVDITVCRNIAELCGIKDDEIGVILHYLHHVAGTLLHYPDIPELQHCVITDFQLIFDSISKVIIQYFDKSADIGDGELFHKKGQFKASVLQKIDCCLSVSELLALLQHRHIVSQMGKKSFFMPSVLPKAKVEPSSADSCSFLVMFEHVYCPVGLFCAATTRLIVAHKWEVNTSEQFRNRISFLCSISGNWYIIVFTAFSVHYEVKLVDKAVPSQIKLEIYKAVSEAFGKICKDLEIQPPVYGFYCPGTCTYDGSTYPQYQHPAKCMFGCSEAKQMKCFYTDTISKLTDEHKMWFQKEQFQEPLSIEQANPTLKHLLHFTGKTKTFNVAALVGTAYPKMGVFLLNDETGTVVEALEHEHVRDAEKINMAIFSRWLQGKGAQPVAWSTLIGVLRKIGLCELADDIEGGLK